MSEHLFGTGLDTDALWDSPAIDELATAFAAGAVSSIRGGATPVVGLGGQTAMTMDEGGWGDDNSPPVAFDDAYYALHDMPLFISSPGVTWNDYDPDADPITAQLDSTPSHAAYFDFSEDGGFAYEPQSGWIGSDSFTYHATDGPSNSNTATVHISVFNMPPEATADTYGTIHDFPLSVPAEEGVLENDTDEDCDGLTAVRDSYPSHYTAFNLAPDGGFTYTPTPNWVGQDSFTYHATDGIDDSAIMQVTINVGNIPPEVQDDGPYFVAVGGKVTVDPPGVRENDSDFDGDKFTLSTVTLPSHGTLSHFDDDLNQDNEGDGGFTYTAASGYLGVPGGPDDTFTYKANDTYDDSETDATVTINYVLPIPDIDTDSDNNGTIERSQLEENDELLAPGRIIEHNIDDDNGDLVPDRDQAPLVDEACEPVMDNELFPAELSLDSFGTDVDGFTLELAVSAGLRVFSTQDKQWLQMSYVIGTDDIPGVIYVEGFDLGQGTVDWILRDPAGLEINRDSVLFTVVYLNLTGYRPQTEAYGAPFARTPIPADEEVDPGAGIRRNGDDDDGNGTPDWNDTSVAGENDLIEVEVTSRPAASPELGTGSSDRRL